VFQTQIFQAINFKKSISSSWDWIGVGDLIFLFAAIHKDFHKTGFLVCKLAAGF
jgi:hypothetical protein